MMGMQEQVAKALLRCMMDNNSTHRGEDSWREYLGDARKVIEAMCIPTPQMSAAGSLIHRKDNYPTSDLDAELVWQKMIDAALVEQDQ